MSTYFYVKYTLPPDTFVSWLRVQSYTKEKAAEAFKKIQPHGEVVEVISPKNDGIGHGELRRLARAAYVEQLERIKKQK